MTEGVSRRLWSIDRPPSASPTPPDRQRKQPTPFPPEPIRERFEETRRVRFLTDWDGRSLWFHRPLDLKVWQPVGEFKICLRDLMPLQGRGSNAAQAEHDLVRQLLEELTALQRRPYHRLTLDQRTRRRRLYGLVDLVASGLAPDVHATTWLLGLLRHDDDDQLRFRELGGDRREFQLTEELSSALAATTMSGNPRFAEVRTGAAGEAVGPVVRIEEPLVEDVEGRFAAWADRGQADE